MSDLLQTGGVGGLSALMGGLISFFGLKNRMDAVDKRIDTMSEHMVYNQTCEVTVEGIKEKIDTQTVLITEVRTDIKDILREIKKT